MEHEYETYYVDWRFLLDEAERCVEGELPGDTNKEAEMEDLLVRLRDFLNRADLSTLAKKACAGDYE